MTLYIMFYTSWADGNSRPSAVVDSIELRDQLLSKYKKIHEYIDFEELVLNDESVLEKESKL